MRHGPAFAAEDVGAGAPSAGRARARAPATAADIRAADRDRRVGRCWSVACVAGHGAE